MRDRTDCPAILFCRVRASPKDNTLLVKFFRCSTCKRALFEAWYRQERYYDNKEFDNGEGDFSGEIHEYCPLLVDSARGNVCIACRARFSSEPVLELGGPSEYDEDGDTHD